MSSSVRILTACVCFMMTPLARAQVVDSVNRSIESTRCGRLDPELDLTILGLRIGHSTLTDVEKRLGAGRMFRSPPSSVSAPNLLCYSAGQTVVVFESGPMGGWSELTGIAVMPRNDFAHAGSCVAIRRKTVEVATGRGLRLGSPVSEVVRVLGPPTGAALDLLYFDFRGDSPDRTTRIRPAASPDSGPSDWFFWLEGVIVKTKDGVVTQFEVYQAIGT